MEKVISELFEGHTSNFIDCINVDYKSTRRESFMDLQLDVKGCRDIYASFDRYTEVERLEGQNQYKAEGLGLQVGTPTMSSVSGSSLTKMKWHSSIEADVESMEAEVAFIGCTCCCYEEQVSTWVLKCS